jgi:hypothetical protein
VGGQSRSLDGWQNRYSYDIAGTTVGFEGVIMGLKASIIKFQNPTVVPTVYPLRLCLGQNAQSEAKFYIYYIGSR